MNSENTSRVKIAFKITKDADDYPPVDWERLWAFSLGNGEFELDNIPFFAKDVSSGDVVSALDNQGNLIFDRVLRSGGHSTIRVIMFDVGLKEQIRSELSKLGCETEGSHLPSLFTIDVPLEAKYGDIFNFLEGKLSASVLEYEESAIRHSE